MRYRLMATYLGVPYHAGLGPGGMEATLFSPAPPPGDPGFTVTAGNWRKQVSVTDLSALWQSRPVGEYRGEPCLVLDDLGDRLHIAYLGRDAARAAQLGYWEIDREVFEVVVARRDVTGLVDQRVDFPPAAAMFRSSGTGPAENGGMDHPARATDRVTAWHGSPGPEPWPQARAVTETGPGRGGFWPQFWAGGDGVPEPEPAAPPGRRTGGKHRVSPESVLAELLTLSAIPQACYAVDEEVPGAMCLVKADGGFEVFSRTDDARLEVRFFADEEAAYFYLFGVLAAEAVRSGRLGPLSPGPGNGHRNVPGAAGGPAPSAADVSKYLHSGVCLKWLCRPARV